MGLWDKIKDYDQDEKKESGGLWDKVNQYQNTGNTGSANTSTSSGIVQPLYDDRRYTEAETQQPAQKYPLLDSFNQLGNNQQFLPRQGWQRDNNVQNTLLQKAAVDMLGAGNATDLKRAYGLYNQAYENLRKNREEETGYRSRGELEQGLAEARARAEESRRKLEEARASAAMGGSNEFGTYVTGGGVYDPLMDTGELFREGTGSNQVMEAKAAYSKALREVEMYERWLKNLNAREQSEYTQEVLKNASRSELERTSAGRRYLERQALGKLTEASDTYSEAFLHNGDESSLPELQEKERQAGEEYAAAIKGTEEANRLLRVYNENSDTMRALDLAEQAESDPNFREKIQTGKTRWQQEQSAAKADEAERNRKTTMANDLNDPELQHYLEENRKAAGVNTDLETKFAPENLNRAGKDVYEALHGFRPETLSQDQRDIYYALYADDPKLAAQWAKIVTGQVDQAYLQQVADWAGKNPKTRVAALLAGSNMTLASGLDPFGERGQWLNEYGQTLLSGGGQGLQEKGLLNKGILAGEIKEDTPLVGWMLKGKSLNDLYQLSASMIQSGETALLGSLTGPLGAAAGTMLMGSSAAASDYREQLDRGVDEKTAKAHATAAGIAEALFEYVSIDKLLNQDITKTFLRNFLEQAGVEATEEITTSIANRLSDGLILHANGYDSDLDRRRRELMAQGLSYQDADARAEWDWVVDVLNDGLGGFLSGGMMTVGNYAGSYAAGKIGAGIDSVKFQNQRNELYGKLAQSPEAKAALQQYAQDNNVKAKFSAESLEGFNYNQTKDGTGNPSATNQNGTENPSAAASKATTRSDGKSVQKVIDSMAQQMQGQSLEQIQQTFDGLVEKYGTGIRQAAQDAVTQAAAQRFSDATNVAELEKLHGEEVKAAQGDLQQPVRTAYDMKAMELIAKEYRETGTVDRSRENAYRGRAGETVDVRASYATESGQTATAELSRINDDGTVTLSDGHTAKIADLQMDADTKSLLQDITRVVQGEEANALFSLYKTAVQEGGVTDGYTNLAAAITVYESAARGVSKSVALSQAKGLSRNYSEFAGRVWELGNEAHKQAVAAGQAKVDNGEVSKGKFKVSFDGVDYAKLNKAQRNMVNLATVIANATGIEIEFFQSKVENGKYVGEQGSYQNGKIRLDINAGKNYVGDVTNGMMKAMSHELTHFIEQFSPKLYAELKSAIMDVLTEKYSSEGVNRLIREKIDRSKDGLSRTEAEAEVIADGCELLLRDSKAVQELMAEHRTLGEKILDWIEGFLKRLRDAFGDTDRAEAKAVMENLEQIQKLWDNALKDAVKAGTQTKENTATEGGDDIQLSARDEAAFKPFSEKVNNVVNSAIEGKGYIDWKNEIIPIVPVGPKIEAMVSASSKNAINLSQKMLAINPDLAWHEYRRHTIENDETSRNQIAFTKRQFLNAIKAIASPDMVESIFTNTNNPTQQQSFAVVKRTDRGRYIVVEAVGGKKNPTVYPVMILQFTKAKWNSMVNQGKTLGEILYSDNQKKLAALDIAKNKASRVTAAKFASLAAFATDDSTSYPPHSPRLNNSINEVEQDVKGSQQNSDRDYLAAVEKGDMETAQRMVDEAAKAAGYTIKAYHGTEKNNVFNVFSKEYRGKNHDGKIYDDSEEDQRFKVQSENAFYFAVDRDYAEQYGDRIIEVYLKVDEEKQYYITYNELQDMTPNEIQRLFDDLIREGYNSLYIRDTSYGNDEIAVFDSEQIKSADPVTYDDQGKVIPLSERFNPKNEDIRYSERDLGHIEKNAVKHFGTTDNFRLAGYILTDGEMLDFSGAHWLDKDFYTPEEIAEWRRKNDIRQVDHEDIYEAFPEGSSGDTRKQFMDRGNIRIVPEAPGINLSVKREPTSKQYSQIREFVREYGDQGKFFVDLEGDRPNKINYSGRINAERIINDIKHFYATGEVRQPSAISEFFSERDYSQPSDVDLLLQATETTNGEQKKLLQEFKAKQKEVDRLTKEQQKLKDQVADLQAQMKTTDRALNTKGISGVVRSIMTELGIGDAKQKGLAAKAASMLTDTYTKALAKIDANDPDGAWKILSDGAQEIAEYLIDNGTYSEKFGYQWETTAWSKRFAEDRSQAVRDIMGDIISDFSRNRYRNAIQPTKADRLVEKTAKGYEQKLSAQSEQLSAKTEENTRLQEENERLRRRLGFSESNEDSFREQLKRKERQLAEAQAEAKKSGQASTQLQSMIEALENRVKELRKERDSLKGKVERREGQIQRERKSAAHDLLMSQINTRVSQFQTRLAEGKAARTEAGLRGQISELEARISDYDKLIAKQKKIMEGKMLTPELRKLLAIERARASHEMQVKKEEQFRNYKTRKVETDLRNRIKNLHDEMQRELISPKQNHFIPQNLARPVVELLEMVSTRKYEATTENALNRIDAINRAYDQIKNDQAYSMFYDNTVKQMLVELGSTLEGRNIYELNADELDDVYTVMKAMRTTIRNAIKADLIEKGRNVYEIGTELRKELQSSFGAHGTEGFGRILEKYHMAQLNAQRAFNRFGGYRENSTWNKVYRMLADAQLHMLDLEMRGTKIFDRVLASKEAIKQAEKLTSYKEKDLVDVGLKDENGNAVKITRGMMLALYMHMQNEDNLRHIIYGGLTLPDLKKYYNSKQNAWDSGSVRIPALGAYVADLYDQIEELGEQEVASRYEEEEKRVRSDLMQVLANIREKMTEYDLEWIKASREFFDKFSRRELNAVTQAMYGFSKANVENYFPIVTDKNFLKTEFDTISKDISLENAGFMKDRVKAGNPILLEDLTRTVNRQISNVSRYAGLTQALKQFNAVYNTTERGYRSSVKEAMSKAFEDTGKDYIQNLITDMVGGRSQPASIFDRLKGNYAQAVLSANLSVTIKQAASFPTAAAVVGWGPIFKALAKGGQKGLPISRANRALIDTYSPLLWKRAQGAIDTEIGDIAKAQDWTKKASWLMGWIEKMDIATVGRLWSAAEYYVNDNFKNLQKGTEAEIKAGQSEYYQKVAEIFNRIVEETQPNYTVLQRPDILRNPNKLLRSVTMFSTQRLQNAQILMDAIAEYNAWTKYNKRSNSEETRAGKKAAGQKLWKAVSSQVVSTVVLNAMTLFAGAVMHRMNPWRDDDDELTAESIMEQFLTDFASTLSGSFLGGSKVFELLNAILRGKTYYEPDVGGISTVTGMAKAVYNLANAMKDTLEKENSTPEDWMNIAQKQLYKVGEYLAQMTGIPVANVVKILQGAAQHGQDIANGEFGSFEAGINRAAAKNASRYLEAWQDGDQEKQGKVYQEMISDYLDKGKSQEEAEKAAKSQLTSAAKTAYLDGSLTEEQAQDFLMKNGLDEDEAYWKVLEWNGVEKYDELEAAMDTGADISEAVADLEAHGVTEKAVNDRISDYLKENLLDGSITEEKAIELLQQYRGDSEKDAYWKVQEWQAKDAHANEEDYNYTQYENLKAAIDGNQDPKAAMKELTDHGVKEKDAVKYAKKYIIDKFVSGEYTEEKLKNYLVRYCGIVQKETVEDIVSNAKCKKQYGVNKDDLEDAYKEGDITKSNFKSALKQYNGMTDTEAEHRVSAWDLKIKHPELEWKIDRAEAYLYKVGENQKKLGFTKSAKDMGIPVDVYNQFISQYNDIKGEDKNGDGKTDTNSLKRNRWKFIQSLNLTQEQKEWFYGWSYSDKKGRG